MPWFTKKNKTKNNKKQQQRHQKETKQNLNIRDLNRKKLKIQETYKVTNTGMNFQSPRKTAFFDSEVCDLNSSSIGLAQLGPEAFE